jgi:hypothetical protein
VPDEENNFDRRLPSKFTFSPSDNGGRRSSIDRRCLAYSIHIPERRFCIDRRSSDDRRKIAQKGSHRHTVEKPQT